MDIGQLVIERRAVVQAGGLVAAGAFLAACSSGGSTASTTSAAAPSAPASAGGSAAAAGTTLTKVADVPVGGGVVVPDSAVVVTQPTSGTIKGFSAICPHQGCLVNSVENNEIICPCHGSKFSAEDGSVIQGPAQQPLAPAPVSVSNGTVVLNA